MTQDTQNSPKHPFVPSEHFIPIKTQQGDKDYLPVAARLVWFREQCPEGVIETEMLHLDLDRDTEEEANVWNAERRRSEKITKHAKGFVIFRAVARDGKGGAASGTKSEKAASFPDFIEKCESGAIGRALAALGYGTQFAGDEWDEAHRIVDASADAPQANTTKKTSKQATTPQAGKNDQAKQEQHPPLDEQIKQAKLRAQTLGLACDTTEWANLLKKASVTVIKSAVDLAKIIEHMDQFEQEASATSSEAQPQTPKTDTPPLLVSEQQSSTITKLCGHLGREVPADLSTMTFEAAGKLITELSAAYKEARSALPVR